MPKMTFALLSLSFIASSAPALAQVPLDESVVDARCLVRGEAAAKAGKYKDMGAMMHRGIFAGRIVARSGVAAGGAAVAQARKDLRNAQTAPTDLDCANAKQAILGSIESGRPATAGAPPQDAGKSPEALCTMAYGTALSTIGIKESVPYYHMGGYDYGVYSIRQTASLDSLSKQMKPIPDRELKGVLARCTAEADGNVKGLLGK